MDTRPANCRFRLQDEGKGYPRSSCVACGKTITTGLGTHCTFVAQPERMAALFDRVEGGALAAAFMVRIGVDRIEFTREELATLTFREVQRQDQHDGTIVFRLIK